MFTNSIWIIVIQNDDLILLFILIRPKENYTLYFRYAKDIDR